MQHFELKGQLREVGNKATIKAFRKQGLVPCNLYGCGTENILFTVDAKELKGVTNTPKAYIIDLNIDGTVHTAILHELQFHPVSDECLHVDFLAVNDAKPVTIQVPIIITGHAKGVQMGGKFVQKSRSIRICGLMENLPDDVTVDISGLGLDKKIKAGELKFDKFNVTTDKDTIICAVLSTRNSSAESESAEGEAAE